MNYPHPFPVLLCTKDSSPFQGIREARLTFLQTFLQAAPAPWHNFYCSPVEIPKVPEPKHVGSPFCVPRWRVLESVGETTGNVVGQKHEVFSTRECMAELLCIRIRFYKYMVASIQNDNDSVIYSVCIYIYVQMVIIFQYRWPSQRPRSDAVPSEALASRSKFDSTHVVEPTPHRDPRFWRFNQWVKGNDGMGGGMGFNDCGPDMFDQLWHCDFVNCGFWEIGATQIHYSLVSTCVCVCAMVWYSGWRPSMTLWLLWLGMMVDNKWFWTE